MWIVDLLTSICQICSGRFCVLSGRCGYVDCRFVKVDFVFVVVVVEMKLKTAQYNSKQLNIAQ